MIVQIIKGFRDIEIGDWRQKLTDTQMLRMMMKFLLTLYKLGKDFCSLRWLFLYVVFVKRGQNHSPHLY